MLSVPGLVLRQWRRSDVPALEAACGDPEICRFTTVPQQFTPAEAQAWVDRQIEHGTAGCALVLAIVPTDAGSAVGMIGIFGLKSEDGPRLGYWITRGHRRRGIATRAARALVDWASAQAGVAPIFMDIEPGNVASRRIAAHLGANHTGRRIVDLCDGRRVTLDRFVLDPGERRQFPGA